MALVNFQFSVNLKDFSLTKRVHANLKLYHLHVSTEKKNVSTELVF